MYIYSRRVKAEDKLRALAEKAYNNRARVPEHGEIIAGWERDAAAYRAIAECALDVPYLDPAAGGTARTRLDFFWPPNTDRQACPIAMFVHGGYWQSLDRKYFSHLAKGLNGRGVAVAIPSYDLCPQASIAQIADQIAAACVWLWRQYGRRIAVGGHSAGGHLTAAMMVRDFSAQGAPLNLVTGGLPISGLFDLRDLVYTSINDKCMMSLEQAHSLSPLFATPPKGKTLHSWVGGEESEAFVWQSKTIARVWRKGGVEATHRLAKGDDHFTVVRHLETERSAMTGQFAALAEAARIA